MEQDSLQSVNVNAGGVKERTFDAIVIGSGISGGWAAKELCELGLKTLVLERGRNVVHNKDYPTATKDPWDFKYRGRVTRDYEGGRLRSGHDALFHSGQRPSLRPGKTFRLDPRISGGRKIIDLGTSNPKMEQV